MADDFQKEVNTRVNDMIDAIALNRGVDRGQILEAATQALSRHRDGTLRPAEPCVQKCWTTTKNGA